MNRQQCSKRLAGQCFFCGNTDYEVLEAHRIVPGCEGGRYEPFNILVVCANHHNLITRGKIKVHRALRCTFAERVIHWTDENGDEHYDPDPRKEE